MQEKGEISRRDFLKFFTQFSGSLLLGVTGIKNLLDGDITRGVFTSGVQQGQNTPIPTSTWKPTKTSIPTITRRPPATATPMPSATSTRKPYPTPSSTVTPIPTADRATPTYTASPLPSPTPDLRGMTDPNFDNFELTIGHLALAINAVSVMQAGRNEIDMTDIVEDFLNFNPEKYQAYLRGERPYRYLKFQEVKKSDDPDAPTQIRAVIVVTNSFHGQNDREYLDLILNYLQTVLKVSMHRIDEEKKSQIMRDIGESNRFTCIKFLRFVWSLFGEDPNTEMGLFPEVYQARIVNAGELERQVAGNKSIFDPAFAGVVKPTLIKNALAISGDPEDDPDLFDGKVMVFFRQPAFKGESGHVGVGKLTAQRDKNGDLIRFLISFIEVDGNTGQAYSGYRVYMDDFRAHLFMGTQTKEGFTARKAGWMFLTE